MAFTYFTDMALTLKSLVIIKIFFYRSDLIRALHFSLQFDFILPLSQNLLTESWQSRTGIFELSRHVMR